MVQSLPSIIEFILSFFENNFSKHTGYRCFCELVQSEATHECLHDHDAIKVFLMYIAAAGRRSGGSMCIELLLSAVFGISMLVVSPDFGRKFLAVLLFPAT